MSRVRKKVVRSDNEMLQLVLDKLRARGLTSADLARYENVEEFTRAQLVKRFEEYLSKPENYFRKNKAGKNVALLRPELFRNFANRYAEQVAEALGIRLLSSRVRSVSKRERLLAELMQGDLAEPLVF